MSYTMRDAQHLCWKTFKKIEKANQTPTAIVTELLEVGGKVAATVKDLPPEKPETKEKLASELSDMLYLVFILAEHYNINMEETFLETMNNYMLRFIK